MVDATMVRIETELGHDTKEIATDEHANVVKPLFPQIRKVIDDLTPEGL